MLCTSLRTLLEYLLGRGCMLPCRIFTITDGREEPSKARFSVVSSNKMQPSAQTSLLVLCGRASQISGACK